LDVFEALGKDHDFSIFKDTIPGYICNKIKFLGDKGYQGIKEFFKNSETPIKKKKKLDLTDEQDEQMAYNKDLSKQRILIEHINREIKIFRICKETYRNKQKRGLLRYKLISSFYNKMLGSG
jgi:hypothetical protein